MASPEPSTGVVTLSIAGILASSPFGINVETIAIGMCFAIVGMFGKFAFEIQRALDAGDKVRLVQALGWVGAGLIGAPFITVAWIVLLKAVGAQTDVATVLGCLFLGFFGPRGVTWLVGLLGSIIKGYLPKGAPDLPKP